MNQIDVKIRKLYDDAGRMKAIVSVTLDNALAIHDIKVIQGQERLFLAMPSRQDENGTFRDTVHPVGAEFRQRIECAVLDAYRAAIEE